MTNKEQRTYCVYMHTCKENGKKYVGITKKKPERRWQNGFGYKDSILFWNAIQKYGWDGFTHEVLFTGLTKEEAESKEIELIAEMNLTNDEFGYNLCEGGRTNIPNQETKDKLSRVLQGNNAKKVYCVELDKVFSSALEAELELGISRCTIGSCCNKKPSYKTAGGYHFVFVNEDGSVTLGDLEQFIGKEPKKITTKGKIVSEETRKKLSEANKGKVAWNKGKKTGPMPLKQRRKIGNKVYCIELKRMFYSASEASVELNINVSHIVSCCRGRYGRKTAGGYHWIYANNGDNIIPEDLKQFISKPKQEQTNKPKPVKCIETGKIYDTAAEAGRDTGANPIKIGQVCRKEYGRKTAGGYHWEFVSDDKSSESD